MIYGRLTTNSGILALASRFFSAVRAQETSYIHFDNSPYLANASNVVEFSWPSLKAALASPNRSDVASYNGFDWTQPYPGTPLSGFSTHLRIADDLAFPDSVTTENVRTNVASISYGIPPPLMNSDGFPKGMDSSWYICQHYFVSTVPDPTKEVDHDCSFLPKQCQQDLKSSLVKKWGTFMSETGAMCGANALELITPSCRDALGLVRADVLAWDASNLADRTTSKTVVVDEVSQYSWMIGTGFSDPYNQTSYYAASNRTYLIATVFGHSADVDNPAEPVAELACLRPAWSAIPTATTTGRITSTSSSVLSEPSTAAPVVPTSSQLASSSSTLAVPAPTSHCKACILAESRSQPSSLFSLDCATVFPCQATLTTGHLFCLVGGTIKEGASVGLTGLCSFSCDYDRCEEEACVCTSIQGCPAPGLDKDGDDYEYFVDLCAFSYVQKFCAEADNRAVARARNARLVMSDTIPEIATDRDKPYCIWYPDVASEKTYRELVRRYPDMRYVVGRACAVAGYTALYAELGLLPEVSIAEEARDSATEGSKEIFDSIMRQPVCYAVLDDYTRSCNPDSPLSPAFMNGDTAVRSTLDTRLGLDKIEEWGNHYFNITEDYNISEVSSGETYQELPAEHIELFYTPILSHLPTINKNALILMAAYEGNLERYVRLRRPKMLHDEEPAVIRGIYHNTAFAKWWSLQKLDNISRRFIKAATLARFIMVNDLSHIPPSEHDTERLPMPVMIWWPLIPAQETLRELARRRPDMNLQVAMACIQGDYRVLWDELAPEPCSALWDQARQQQTQNWPNSPNRNYYVDYLERRAEELGGNIAMMGNGFNSECEDAAVRDKEPTTTWLDPGIYERPYALQNSYPHEGIYYPGGEVNAASWHLVICSSEELRRKAREEEGIRLYDE
ncbi:hypothetical protein LX32DRAFT_660138 [Colletotrichum zoysiae]|uniref:Uncharacterized protein n=1 Tax=Colletotrichum zoysiae TaxID=1216348 RepID=A0AAD9M4C9_9PEZI|nr:hypothetical protein LX32DRAFT_660138 [Colletotrichum zoysiae]